MSLADELLKVVTFGIVPKMNMKLEYTSTNSSIVWSFIYQNLSQTSVPKNLTV